MRTLALLCLAAQLAADCHSVESEQCTAASGSDPSNSQAASCSTGAAPPPPTPPLSPVSALDFLAHDSKLKADAAFPAALARWNVPASRDALKRTAEALRSKSHVVRVFQTGKEANDYLQAMVKDGAAVSYGYSTTLKQIGFLEGLRGREAKVTNWKAKAYEAAAKGDFAKQAELLQQGYVASLYFSSVTALTEDGIILAADASGSRLGGWLSSSKLVIVAGANKIVNNETAALERLNEYQVKLESARCREVYKIPGAQINNVMTIRGGNARAPRIEVIIVEGEALGF